MSRVCCICGKARVSGNSISHSHIKTRRVWNVNVHKVKVTDEKGAVIRGLHLGIWQNNHISSEIAFKRV